MRVLPLLALGLLALPPAAADAPHDACGESVTVLGGGVHVDAWLGPCVGVMVLNNVMLCLLVTHGHLGPVHWAVLDEEACRTGVIVELS